MNTPVTGSDHCPPPCGKLIRDYDPDGYEAPDGQRYCTEHRPDKVSPEEPAA